MLKAAAKALRVTLAEVPFLKIKGIIREPRLKGLQPDFMVKLGLPEGEQMLLVEVKTSGQPWPAREAINQLYRYRLSFPGAYGIFIAPFLSDQTMALCAREGVGCLDLAGNCRLSFSNVYIRKDGRPNPFGQRRELRSLYSPKAGRVLRVLLSHPGKRWRVQALAREAGVSLGHVPNVTRRLLDREWVQAEPGGLVLIQPRALLQEWAQNYDLGRHQRHDFYSLESVDEIESRLAAVCRKEGLQYALTGFSGAARLAPFARYQRAMVYVEGGIEGLAKALKLKAVTSGANLSLWSPSDAGVFYGAKKAGNAVTAGPVQIYLDLTAMGDRAQEAAEHLWEQVIKPLW